MPDSAPQNVYVHNHGIYETCDKSCPANDWWQRPGADNARVFYNSSDGQEWLDTTYPGEKNKPVEGIFNRKMWYPISPLTSNEKAFLWVADNDNSEHGEVVEDTSHYKIIERISKRNIYDFLKASEKSTLPMLWGYVVYMPDNKMYVKFLTHINPGKQDLEHIGPSVISDIEDKFNRKVIDYDIEETKTPILESYTPQNVETTGFQGTEPGISDAEKTQQIQDAMKPKEEPDYEAMAGEFKTVRQDVLESGMKISTVFLGGMAPDPNEPFETLVYDPDNVARSTQEVHYNATETAALTTHFQMVDKYNRKALEQHDAHIQIMSYFNDAGILATDVHPDQLRLLPETHHVKAVEITPDEDAEHENGEKPFMYHYPSNTLFYTTKDCHHMHIIPQINQHLLESGQSYDGPWVTGDITDPRFEDRNWIKFIGSDSGQYPESVINYMQQKFGPRDLVYNGYDGWENLPDELIEKR